MAVHSPTVENRRRAEQGADGGRKTLLGLLLSVRMKDRSYLQATVANGRNGERVEGLRGGETSRERTRQIGLWDSATIRFSLSAPQSAPFLFSPVCERGACILGIRSGVLAERISLVTRFVAVVIFDEIRWRWVRRTWRNKWSSVSNEIYRGAIVPLDAPRCIRCVRIENLHGHGSFDNFS